jgi:predicted hydrocarbon binding protein
MDPISKSGYFLPNRLARFTLISLAEMLGDGGMQTLLEISHLPELSNNFPPANLERAFDFADYSALNQGLEEMYGERGGRGFALRAGSATFAEALKDFGALAGTGNKAFKILPLSAKFKIALPAMTKIFNEMTDQRTRFEEHEHHYHYLIHRNPVCWGRSGEEKPVCFLQVGLLQEAMKSISGGNEFRVDEAECKAMSANVCRFVIHKEALA